MKNKKSVLEIVLGELADVLAHPSDEFPTVRCISKPRLVSLLGRVVKKLGLAIPSSLSAIQIVQLLLRSRVVTSVPLDSVAPGVPIDRFLAIGLGVDASMLNPLELLQAHRPDGVVCYFSALMVHQLVTQPTTHHHIAEFRKPSPSASRSKPELRTTRNPPPMGSPDFSYRGLGYYRTKRDPRYLAAFQRFDLNEESWFRATTLEQTLVDAVHRPMSCGGPPVVFEAWENGAELLKIDRLIALLKKIDDDNLSRRVGFMMELYGLQFDGVDSARRPNAGAAVPLLVGIPYTKLDNRWNLLVP